MRRSFDQRAPRRWLCRNLCGGESATPSVLGAGPTVRPELEPEPGWEHMPELPPGLEGQSLELAPWVQAPALVRALALASRALPAEPQVLEPVRAVVTRALPVEPPGRPALVLARALRLGQAVAAPPALQAESSALAPARV